MPADQQPLQCCEAASRCPLTLLAVSRAERAALRLRNLHNANDAVQKECRTQITNRLSGREAEAGWLQPLTLLTRSREGERCVTTARAALTTTSAAALHLLGCGHSELQESEGQVTSKLEGWANESGGSQSTFRLGLAQGYSDMASGRRAGKWQEVWLCRELPR
jgi:hypothetical protein